MRVLISIVDFQLEEVGFDIAYVLAPDRRRLLARGAFARGASVAKVLDLLGDKKKDEEIVLEALRAVNASIPEWTEISFIGVAPTATLVAKITAPNGIFSGIYIESPKEGTPVVLASGLLLTKTLQPPPLDQVRIWSQNLPPKGLLRITDRAKTRILEIRDDLNQQEPGMDWIPALSWGSRATKRIKDDDWDNLGDGLSLGFFPRTGKFPEEAIESVDGLEIIFRVGRNFDFFRGRAVDYLRGNGGFVIV